MPQILHASSAHQLPAPMCGLPMNLNLVPKQLPSIILAATANSSPDSHFSPLKKPFSLFAATELPRSLAQEIISQQAHGPATYHRWEVWTDARVSFRFYCICVQAYAIPCVTSLCSGLLLVSSSLSPCKTIFCSKPDQPGFLASGQKLENIITIERMP